MKKIRNIVVALCLVMCSVVLVACGGANSIDKEASVSKKGYVNATKSDYSTYMTDNPEATTAKFKSYKLTMKMEYAKGEKNLNLVSNVIVTIDDNNAITGLALKYNLGDNMKINMYYKEKYAYLHYKSESSEYKYKAKVNPSSSTALNSTSTEGTASGKDESIFDGYNNFTKYIQQILTKLEKIEDSSEVKFEKATKGNNVRFHISATVVATTSDIYMEFTNNSLVGIEMISTVNEISTSKIALVKFDGKIKYPSFKNYEEVSEETVAKLFDAVELS